MEKFRKQLIDLINSTQLPAEAVYYIVKDVYRDLYEDYQSYLREVEQQEQANKEKEE